MTPSRTSTNQSKLVIAVLTCSRPVLLKAALDSLSKLVPPKEIQMELLLVDNAEETPAIDIFTECRPHLPFPAKYVLEPQRGLSYARNRAISHCLQTNAQWLIFLDDDETVQPDWILQLMQIQQRHKAFLITGKINKLFPQDAPAWSYAALETTDYQNGDECYELDTGNSMIHADVFRQLLFDPQFALSGGEDSDYSAQAKKLGFRIVYAQHAVVNEDVQPYKLTLSWNLKRSFRGGCARAGIDKKLYGVSIVPRKIVRGCLTLLKAIFRIAIARSRTERVLALMSAMQGLGLCLGSLGVSFSEYSPQNYQAQ
ncbi:MAG: glycosyltransferase [Gammaproteobacteria bacterium]|nr:glycosyltransferase [Gammaproteobacteria bacterium]MDH5802589.1 glycosyltransferase [Gammaproteobacteria bacterium]